jgi:IS5 family transposase
MGADRSASQNTRVWDDQAYRGQRVVIREHAPKARDFTNRRYRHRGVVDEVERAKNRTKSKARTRVGSYWAAKGRNVSAARPATVQPPQYGINAAQ